MDFVYSLIQQTLSFLSLPVVQGVSFFGIVLALVLFLLIRRFF